MKITNREIKSYEINGKNYEFICESWETYNSWGHEVELFRDSWSRATERRRYYNRTWERFKYQSCMLGAIDNAISGVVERAFNEYKYKNNLSRFRKGEKEKVMADIMVNNEEYKELKKLYDYIDNVATGYTIGTVVIE